MNKRIITILLMLFGLTPSLLYGQIDSDQLGSWYIYFWKTQLAEKQWGFQGDIQYRNWNILGDLEQLLIRGGVTYTPKNTEVLLTVGYANINTGQYGQRLTSTIMENRIYQEALLPNTIGKFHFTHRFRYEQRIMYNQEFRTRYRYNLFLNIPLKGNTIDVKSPYLALYNELFINGQNSYGQTTNTYFDRNRFYAGIGYKAQKNLKFQLAVMKQTTNNYSKNQLQISGHHSF